MGSCAAPSAKGDDKFITTDYLQQCPLPCVHHSLERYPRCEDRLNFAFQREPAVLAAAERQGEARE
uniref:hypothetical protein n=1 Tax=Klebsiella pneumoniae TaxID=573 RepID=UPI0015EF6CF6|nr:hypothetical protein [Klebsiella pneumoniae]